VRAAKNKKASNKSNDNGEDYCDEDENANDNKQPRAEEKTNVWFEISHIPFFSTHLKRSLISLYISKLHVCIMYLYVYKSMYASLRIFICHKKNGKD